MTDQHFTEFEILSGGASVSAVAQGDFVPWQARQETEDEAREELPEGHEMAFWRRFEREKRTVLADITMREEKIAEAEKKLVAQQEELAKKITEANGLLAVVSSFAKEVPDLKKGQWATRSEELAEFSLALAEKIISTKINIDHAAFSNYVKAVIEEAKPDGALSISVNPEDFEIMKLSADQTVQELIHNQHFSWISDVKFKRGDLIIDTSRYRYEAGLKTALDSMKQDLCEWFESTTA